MFSLFSGREGGGEWTISRAILRLWMEEADYINKNSIRPHHALFSFLFFFLVRARPIFLRGLAYQYCFAVTFTQYDEINRRNRKEKLNSGKSIPYDNGNTTSTQTVHISLLLRCVLCIWTADRQLLLKQTLFTIGRLLMARGGYRHTSPFGSFFISIIEKQKFPS